MIAESYGLSGDAVIRLLRREGVEIRDHVEAFKSAGPRKRKWRYEPEQKGI